MITSPVRRIRRRLPVALLASLVVLPLVPQDADSPSDAEQGIQRTREAMRLWVETRRAISAEEKDWRLGKDLLESRIAATRREIESRRLEITEAEASITDADRKRMELTVENDRLKEGSAVLEDIIAGLEARTRGLVVRLPDPIRDRIRPISVQIPEDPAETTLDLSRRYLNVIGVLNEIDKFNREITEYPELREQADGTSVEVTTVYLGLGQAFYLGRDGEAAGVGRPGAEGWIWTEMNGSRDQIATLVSVIRNETPAKYVELPIVVE